MSPDTQNTSSCPVKVSIVLPTYNHVKYLPQALQSIFGQTFDSYELIVVDDGSTDETAALLKGLCLPNLRVVTQENQGLPAALNRGFAEARGQYWTWTSADNIVGPTWLEELVKALDNSPPEVGYALSHYGIINEKGQICGVEKGQCFETQSLLRQGGNASFLFRADIAKKAGLYDTSLVGAEDLDMWLRMSFLTRGVHVETVLYYYRVHGESMTARIPDKVAAASTRLVEKFIASCGGRVDVERIFPAIKESPNPALARWQAKVWLAGRLIHSPYWPLHAVADILVDAINENYDAALVGNLVAVLGNKGVWDRAADVVASAMKNDQSEFIRALAAIVSQKDKEGLKSVPFTTLLDNALCFDLKGQLSRAKIVAEGGA